MHTRDLEIKAARLTDAGEFTGDLSVFGVKDYQNDVVIKGAFSKTLAQKGPRRPLLFAHDVRSPIGWLDLAETEKGLRVTKGKLLIDDVDLARESYALLKAGVCTGLSIGYEVVDSKWNDREKVRELRALDLFEGSLVVFPALEVARVDSVKSAADLDALNALLHDVRAMRTEKEIAELLRGIRALKGI